MEKITKEVAEKIGSKEAIISVTIGVLIAQAIMMSFGYYDGIVNSFFWFKDNNYIINLLVGVAALYICGYFFGKKAGKAILLKNKDYTWEGFKNGMFTLISATFLASWVGFFQEGINHLGTDEPFQDYIFKPVFLVTLFGLVPGVLVGFLFGKRIRDKGRKYLNVNKTT